MRYNYLGKTGIQVSELCLGTMTFGNEADEPTSAALLNRALDAGINFFDTANIYTKGASEEIIGRWIVPYRENVILASKVHSPMSERINDRGSSRRNIILAVEQSLQRLKTTWLDILYLHQWDRHTALDESLAALDALIQQGKVIYGGVSNFAAWQTVKALGLCTERGLAPVAVVQPMYNLVKRQAEVEILPMAQSEGLGVCSYSPMGAGLLSGKYQKGEAGRLRQNVMYRERYKNPEYMDISDRFIAYAHTQGVPAAALAVAWVASHPSVTSAIVGARDLAQLNETLTCADIHLTPEHRQEISALSITPPLATDRER